MSTRPALCAACDHDGCMASTYVDDDTHLEEQGWQLDPSDHGDWGGYYRTCYCPDHYREELDK